MQNQLGFTAATTGVLLTTWPLATLFTAPLAGFLEEYIHPGILGFIGMLAFASGLFFLSFVDVHTTITSIIPRLMLCGAGFGFFQTPNNSTLISSAPRQRSGGASGMQGMARLFGQTFGTTMRLIKSPYLIYFVFSNHTRVILAPSALRRPSIF